MEGPADEDRTAAGYRPFEPQSFDDAAGAPLRPQPAEGRFREAPREGYAGPSSFEPGGHETGGVETDFASIKFQRENTLLTNAESYAASIREEAQLYVRQLRGEVETLNAEAERRYEEAERTKAEAEAEAGRLLAEARAQVDSVRQAAHDEGYEAGYAEGIQKRYEEAAPTLQRLEAVLEEIAQFRRRVAYYTEKDGVRLALLIAKKVLQSELKTNKQVVAKLVASTLSKLQGKGTFRVWLNPDDHAFLAAARPQLEKFLDDDQTLTLRARPDLAPGNVLIETDREVIDATFETQFYHLEQQLTQTLAEREAVLRQQRASGEAAADVAASSAGAAAGGQPARPTAQQSAVQQRAAQQSAAQQRTAQRNTAQQKPAQRNTAQQNPAQQSAAQRRTAQQSAEQRAAAQRGTPERPAQRPAPKGDLPPIV